MEIIYVYSTESLQYPKTIHKPEGDVHYKPWFKIGMTTQESAEDRIIQQDRTANPEPLIKLYDLDIVKAGHSISAYELEQTIHRKLDRAGKRVRLKREWFQLDGGIEEVKALIESILDDTDVHKCEIALKNHQSEANTFINKCFQSEEKRCLLNHKPRSGKTFLTLFNIKENQYRNIVILTSYPILNFQWEETFEDFKGFSNYKIHNVSGDKISKVELDANKNNIVLLSLQDVKGGEVIFEKEKFDLIKDVEWDLIVIDEIHMGYETEKTQIFMDKIKYKRLLGLSATPGKNLICGSFTKEQTHTYTIVEENKLKKKYPEIYPYADINFYLWKLIQEERDNLDIFSDEEQFTMKKLFRIEKNEFFYKSDLVYIFRKLIGDREICKKDNLGTLYPFKNQDKFSGVKSILMFVPSIDVQDKLINLLESLPSYKEDFNIFTTNSKKYSSKALMNAIKREFVSKDNKRSLIIAVDQLTTGITLEDCDMVVMMNDWESMDKWIQASFRCQSPRKDKTDCFVLDLNPARTYNMIWEYNHIISEVIGKSTEETIRSWFNCVNVFNRVDGGFEQLDFDSYNREYNKVLFERPRFNYNTTIHYDKIDLVREQLLSLNISVGKGSTKVKPEDGIEKGKNKKVVKTGVGGEKNEISNAKLIEIAKALLDKTMLLSIFTYHASDKVDECFEILEEDMTEVPGLGELESKMFLDTLLVGMKDVENVKLSDIKFIYNNIYDCELINRKMYDFNQKIKKIIEIFRENRDTVMLTNYINLIDSYLKPSTTEKKAFAEVMTDFSIIDEMLGLFDKSDWKNPDLKWFGPTAGLGNFEVKIVERLMEGLKEIIKDPEERYKHIIEEQIYISELQSKNISLFLMIFDPDNKYKLNFFRGSFLSKEFDEHMKKVWKVDKFDRCVENPPFNQMVDMDILQKAYKLCDKVAFVHPSTWLLDEKNKQKKFINTKKLVGKDLEQIILFNGNKIFQIALFVPCVITFFSKNRTTKGIKCLDKINDIELVYNDVSEINKFSNNDTYPKLKEKILGKTKMNNVWNFYKSDKNNEKLYMITFTGIRGNVNLKSDLSMIKDDFYTIVSSDRKIQSKTDKVGDAFLKFYFNTENECSNFLNYLKTDFSRFAISIYKNNQNLHRGELEIIPWLDFSQEWTDDKLYKEFDLTEDEIKFIEKHIPKYYE